MPLVLQYPVQMVQEAMESAFLYRDNEQTAEGFEDLRHDDGCRGIKHVTGAGTSIAHYQDQQCIL